MSVREAGVQVEFYLDKVLQGKESQDAGREIYKDEPHVRIRVAGQDKSDIVREVKQKDKLRFPEEWSAFEKGMEAPRHGTPVEQWGRITPSLAATLRTINIRTVEDIASCSDAGVNEIGPGGFKLRDDARKFLSLSQSSADLNRMEELEKANKAKDEALSIQAAQLTTLQAQVAQLLAAQSKVEEQPQEAPEAPRRPRKAA